MCLRAVVTICFALLPASLLAQPQDYFFNSNGVRIRYVEQGTGEPIILLHGLAGSAETWLTNGVFANLAKDFRVIAFDARAHGKSGNPHDPKAYGREMALDITRLMDHLKVGRAHIVGYSMGAGVVTKLVTVHPERVITAILGGSAGRRPATPEELKEVEAEAVEFEQGRAFQSVIKRTWPTDQPPPTDTQLRERTQQALARGLDPLAFAALTRAREELAVTEPELQAVRVPVLAVVGSLDANSANVRRLHTLRPATKLVIIEGAVHGTGDSRGATRRPEFVNAIREFIREHRKGN